MVCMAGLYGYGGSGIFMVIRANHGIFGFVLSEASTAHHPFHKFQLELYLLAVGKTCFYGGVTELLTPLVNVIYYPGTELLSE